MPIVTNVVDVPAAHDPHHRYVAAAQHVAQDSKYG